MYWYISLDVRNIDILEEEACCSFNLFKDIIHFCYDSSLNSSLVWWSHFNLHHLHHHHHHHQHSKSTASTTPPLPHRHRHNSTYPASPHPVPFRPPRSRVSKPNPTQPNPLFKSAVQNHGVHPRLYPIGKLCQEAYSRHALYITHSCVDLCAV